MKSRWRSRRRRRGQVHAAIIENSKLLLLISIVVIVIVNIVIVKIVVVKIVDLEFGVMEAFLHGDTVVKRRVLVEKLVKPLLHLVIQQEALITAIRTPTTTLFLHG